MKQKIKLWFKKHWFPIVMNTIIILQYVTGYLSEQKVQYYIILTLMFFLWNMMFFVTIPKVRQLAYLEGATVTLNQLQKTFDTMKVEKRKKI